MNKEQKFKERIFSAIVIVLLLSIFSVSIFYVYKNWDSVFWKTKYSKYPDSVKQAVEKIVKYESLPIESLYIIPNALWIHELKPANRTHEITQW